MVIPAPTRLDCAMSFSVVDTTPLTAIASFLVTPIRKLEQVVDEIPRRCQKGA